MWNLREQSYTEELQDAVSLATTQAIAFDPGGFVRIPASWIWTMPDGVPQGQPSGSWYTDTPFSGIGSATSFTAVVSGTLYQEELQLYNRFFSAVVDMTWSNDCTSKSPSDPRCLIYPVGALPDEVVYGAKSNSVLLVPDVSRFNRCQNDKGCQGSGDYVYANVYLDQDRVRDTIIAGQPYNMTWWVRSPGLYSSPDPITNNWNDLAGRFLIRYTRPLGSGLEHDFFGGATDACNDGSTGIQCLDRDIGCPIWLSTASGAGLAPFYLNDPVPTDDDAPYTPFSFSFTPGSVQGVGTPWDAKGCVEEPVSQMNKDLCDPKPAGYWTFAFGSWGTSGNTNIPGAKCPGSGTQIPCLNSRLAGSVYIDGMYLTAARGLYISPVFDSLSPNTVWEDLQWDLELNENGGGPRTPVGLSWRASNSGTVFGTGSTAFTGSILPGAGLADCELDTMAGPLACSPVALTTGRFFQWRGDLRNWSENPANPPPPPGVPFVSYPSCTRSSIGFDGSLSPRVRRVSVKYAPDAGRFTSNLLTPTGLRSWRAITYQKDDGAGRVTCDIVDANGTVILANVQNGGLLNGVDVGRYPGIAVRFTLEKLGVGGADPKVYWFKLTFESMKGCLAVDRNVIRLSRGEAAAIRFCTKANGPVELKVHDAAGQLVHRLFNGDLKAGEICQKYWWGTSDTHSPAAVCDLADTNPRGPPVAPGLYVVTVITPAGRESIRLAVSR